MLMGYFYFRPNVQFLVLLLMALSWNFFVCVCVVSFACVLIVSMLLHFDRGDAVSPLFLFFVIVLITSYYFYFSWI